jgi:hypothetical protein
MELPVELKVVFPFSLGTTSGRPDGTYLGQDNKGEYCLSLPAPVVCLTNAVGHNRTWLQAEAQHSGHPVRGKCSSL